VGLAAYRLLPSLHVQQQVAPKPKTLLKASGENQVLSSGPEDCEPSVDPEDFGKGGVEVESEYDLGLRIGGSVGRPGMWYLSLLTVPNKTVRC
jgi:hypothetical protein